MKKSAWLGQAATFVVTLLALHFGGWAWVVASRWLGELGVPQSLLPVLGLGFGLCLFGALMKAALAMSMVKTLRFLPCDLAGASNGRPSGGAGLPSPLPEAIAASFPQDRPGTFPLDLALWEETSRQIEALGFVRVMDFTVEGDKPLPPGFARMFASPGHGARAELNQVFPTGPLAKPTRLTCVFTSVLTNAALSEVDGDTNRWTLETSNSPGHSGSGVTWAWRRPRALWSRHPDWSPAQMLAFHLERRAAMERGLFLRATTGLSWESYCQGSSRALREHRKRLLSRPGLYIWWCNSFGKGHRFWWGDDKNAPPPPL